MNTGCLVLIVVGLALPALQPARIAQAAARTDWTALTAQYVLGLAYTRKGQLKKAASHSVAAYRDRTLYEYVKGQGKY
jgi:hypothetical protein